jgi:formylglycine-generating enzyme required for sulfatase activity/Cdc6-like AAA superfamily ATPase
MVDTKSVYIISDSPEKDSSLFGFDAYARTIAGLIANKRNKTPIVIGIYGPWGSGKTTLMETVKSELKKKEYQKRSIYRGCKTVWFQAWKYAKEEEILAALIEEIFQSMEESGFFDKCKAKIEKLVKGIKYSSLFGKISELFTGQDVSEFFSGLEYKKKIGFYDTFQDFFDRLIWDYLNWRPSSGCSEQTDDRENVLVIFIDDLDRCPKDKILQVLETIKLFMDKQGCIFVIGAANDIIEKALGKTYGEDAVKFMDKIVQVTFNLPNIPEKDFIDFIEEVSPEQKDLISPHMPVIIPAIKNNPRSLKRFLNNLSLQEGLLKNRPKRIDIDFNHIMLWNIIDYIYPALAKDIRLHPVNLDVLRDAVNTVASDIQDQERWEITDDLLNKVPESFHSYIKDKALVDIVKRFTCDREHLNQLITLTKIVESSLEMKEKEDIRGDFGKMVEVPSGEFLYGDDRDTERINEPFKIDVYPVTNAQFKEFIQEGGYENEAYWNKEGKKWKKKANVTEPRYWRDEKWNQPDHPVVGVSFFEASAYAEWAKKRLPTEKEWERAARGTDGREYPWGNEFDKDKCNSDESGIGKTTRVTRYPGGTSPVKCYDMAGNVCEWMDSEEGSSKVLRSGSWGYTSFFMRCAERTSKGPGNRNDDIGFRCVSKK